MLAERYARAFFLQDTFELARQMLGSLLCTRLDGQLTGGRIVELECYLGATDKAAHSYPAKRTKRTEVQFGRGGHAYVFQAYGLHTLFCVVAGPRGVPDTVLIRGLEPAIGLEVMKQRRQRDDIGSLTNGPGKLCQALGITRELYGADLCGDRIWLTPAQKAVDADQIVAARRVGVDYAEEFADKPWRLYITGNDFVSRRDRAAVPLSELGLPDQGLRSRLGAG